MQRCHACYYFYSDLSPLTKTGCGLLAGRVIFMKRAVFQVCLLYGFLCILVAGMALAIPEENTAQFSINQDVEITSEDDYIPFGDYTGRDWGTITIRNIEDAKHAGLGNITCSISGNNFIRPEFPEYAVWNATYTNWVFPQSYILPEKEIFQMGYHTSADTTVHNPVSMWRRLNKSYFKNEGYQFNSYEVIFEDLDAVDYYGRFACTERNRSNASILFDSFTTNAPLSYRVDDTYLHPITGQYTSDINYGLKKSALRTNYPYFFNFTVVVTPKNNGDKYVEYTPRLFLGLKYSRSVEPGRYSDTAVMPETLLPEHLTAASAYTNVTNNWSYGYDNTLKIAFNETSVFANPRPGAGFSSDVTSGAVPLTVRFTNSSTNQPYAWNWSFGDGLYSSKQDPIHTYTGIGIYTVSLNVTNRYGSDTETKTGYITVLNILPGMTRPPTDPDYDGFFEDLNGNRRKDFNDVVLFFRQMTWIAKNEPMGAFDFNGNGRIDFNDIVRLFWEI